MNAYRKILLICTINIACFLYQLSACAKDIPQLTFGIVPQQSAAKIARKWIPICQYLSRKTGFNIAFQTAPDIPEFERRIVAGQYDLAYMNPFHYTVYSKTSGYKAFAKQMQKIKGIIVVRKDSPYKNINELHNQTLAFPSSNAFGASILTQTQFKKTHTPITTRYVKSHDSVYLSVAKGIYPAGGGVVRTFENLNKKTRKQLRILWSTKEHTPHAFAAHPRLPDNTIGTISEVMVSMNKDSEAKLLLAAINFRGFQKANHGDWNDIRALNINNDILQKK